MNSNIIIKKYVNGTQGVFNSYSQYFSLLYIEISVLNEVTET